MIQNDCVTVVDSVNDEIDYMYIFSACSAKEVVPLFCYDSFQKVSQFGD